MDRARTAEQTRHGKPGQFAPLRSPHVAPEHVLYYSHRKRASKEAETYSDTSDTRYWQSVLRMVRITQQYANAAKPTGHKFGFTTKPQMVDCSWDNMSMGCFRASSREVRITLKLRIKDCYQVVRDLPGLKDSLYESSWEQKSNVT